jgi:transposase
MATITIDIDLPPGVAITGYERHGDGHGFEVSWPLPETCRCETCQAEAPARLEWKDCVRVVRDLDILGQPSFWAYQAAFHRCPRCGHRQDLIPPFQRRDVAYTYRFEAHVLRLLVGSNEEEVARRLGVAAETVARIVKNQLAEAKRVDPGRVVTDVGIDEISLKKRHQLYCAVLTDWTRPERPEVLAVAKGRDEAAGRACLGKLSREQREQVRTFRADLGQPFHNACRALLPNARGVADRFHVAKLFNEAVDAERKKNHPGIPGGVVAGGAEGVPGAAVGVPPRPGRADGGAAPGPGRTLPPAPPAGDAARTPGAVQGGL